jgi:glycosyltransferase involved in cell wall biosynthesis
LSSYLINGRFGSQPTTGVQRVAWALLAALDAGPALPGEWRLASPAGVGWPAWRQLRLQRLAPAAGRGHAWEQLVLGAAARRACVINIAGAGPWLGGPQVSWLHDAAVFDHPQAYRPAFVRWYRALFRRRVRRGDLLITPSEFSRGRLAWHLGVPEPRIAVLPHGTDHLQGVPADPTALARLGLQGRDYWLAVASANPSKNLERLLQAHARLPAAGRPWLVLAGAARPRVFASDGVRAAAGDGVRHIGAPDDASLRALMQGARALVLPSLVEGFGLPAVEAMHEGCPVVAARAGALPEVCGDAAEYVDPLDVDDIARGLLATCHGPRRAALQARGTQHVAGRGWAGTAQRFLGLLRAWERPS